MVDTSVLLDLATLDPRWAEWSVAALRAASAGGAPLLADPVVYAELSVRFAAPAELDRFLSDAGVVVVPTPPAALFLAARAHLACRRRGGPRPGVLPDFFVGAHAAVSGLPLVTRDPSRARTDFPDLRLISPGVGDGPPPT